MNEQPINSRTLQVTCLKSKVFKKTHWGRPVGGRDWRLGFGGETGGWGLGERLEVEPRAYRSAALPLSYIPNCVTVKLRAVNDFMKKSD